MPIALILQGDIRVIAIQTIWVMDIYVNRSVISLNIYKILQYFSNMSSTLACPYNIANGYAIIPFNELSVIRTPLVNYDTQLQYRCNDGYRLSEDPSTNHKCNANGAMSGAIVQCIPNGKKETFISYLSTHSKTILIYRSGK